MLELAQSACCSPGRLGVGLASVRSFSGGELVSDPLDPFSLGGMGDGEGEFAAAVVATWLAEGRSFDTFVVVGEEGLCGSNEAGGLSVLLAVDAPAASTRRSFAAWRACACCAWACATAAAFAADPCCTALDTPMLTRHLSNPGEVQNSWTSRSSFTG